MSAGSIQPLDEPKIEHGGSGGDGSERRDGQMRVRDGYLDSDLDHPDGAMANMDIQSSAEVTDAESSVEEEQVGQPVPTGPEPMSLDGTAQEEVFVIDTIGDTTLAHNGPRPQIRSHSPTPSDSSDEVVLFRGRSDHVSVRDESEIVAPQPPSQTDPTQAKVGHVTDTLFNALSAYEQPPQQDRAVTLIPLAQPQSDASLVLAEATQPQPERAIVLADASQEAPRVTKQRPFVPPWPAKEAQHWVHGDGTKGVPSGFTSAPAEVTAEESEMEIDMTPESRRGKKGRRRQNRQLRRLQQDLEDEMVQDYIANMSDADNYSISQRPLGGDEDDWVSSDMDEEGVEADDGVDDTIAALLADGDDDESSELSIDSDPYDSEDDDEDGDDSDLEAAIALAEREDWEDDADLRERQRDAMTDEEIARILAKQESLGMGGDELFLYDDSGFGDVDDARAGLESFAGNVLRGNGKPRNRNANGMKKGKGRKSDTFPDASLMADVIEQDPYGGFDVMDFDRPSLKRKAKGRKSAGALPEELLDLSDDELLDNLQASWAADRSKKSAKKAEREELRMLGLLGSSKKGKKGKKNQPELRQKYLEGITLNQIRDEIRDFLEVEVDNTTKAFPPMEKFDRKILHEIAAHFNLNSKSQGSGKNRFTILVKTQRTLEWTDEAWNPIAYKATKGFLGSMRGMGKGGKGKKKVGGTAAAPRRGGGGNAAVGYRNGEVVGATAPEIAATNFGRKLMEKMGWQKGMALGKEGSEGRLLVPVEAVIKSGKAGLG